MLVTLGLASQPSLAEGDFDAAIRAKVAKEKTKQARSDRKGDKEEPADGAESGGNECGRIDIGNFYAGNKPVRGGPEITVLITGDVINANNHCK